jgi:hypothetical protein
MHPHYEYLYQPTSLVLHWMMTELYPNTSGSIPVHKTRHGGTSKYLVFATRTCSGVFHPSAALAKQFNNMQTYIKASSHVFAGSSENFITQLVSALSVPFKLSAKFWFQ